MNDKNQFYDRIKVEQSKEELKILKLQKEYKNGNICEEDMTEEEYQKLVDLYKKQNKELKKKIQEKKRILRKKLDELK